MGKRAGRRGCGGGARGASAREGGAMGGGARDGAGGLPPDGLPDGISGRGGAIEEEVPRVGGGGGAVEREGGSDSVLSVPREEVELALHLVGVALQQGHTLSLGGYSSGTTPPEPPEIPRLATNSVALPEELLLVPPRQFAGIQRLATSSVPLLPEAVTSSNPHANDTVSLGNYRDDKTPPEILRQATRSPMCGMAWSQLSEGDQLRHARQGRAPIKEEQHETKEEEAKEEYGSEDKEGEAKEEGCGRGVYSCWI